MPSSSTFQSSSFSFSSSTHNGATRSHSLTTHSDPSGTTVHTRSQESGQAPREERTRYDAEGRRVEDAGIKGRIEDVTEEKSGEEERRAEQKGGYREYEERMEEEYAKREGGA